MTFSAAASRGLIRRLKSYRLAGANLSQTDLSGRSALHLASLHGHKEVVEYLLSINVEKCTKDHLHLTPYDYAVKADQKEIISYLTEMNANVTG